MTSRLRESCDDATKSRIFLPSLHFLEGPKNILADNLSQLFRLPTPFQITEGKKLIELAIVSDDIDDKDGFLASFENSGCLEDDI